MIYQLSNRSISHLAGVKEPLVRVVMQAINVTRVDFGVITGVRSIQEQEKLVASGASQTMDSRHLDGSAVDLMAYIGARGSWELNLYDDIADAMREAAKEVGVGIRWGGAWNVPDIRDWAGSMESAMNFYIDSRRKLGKRPFIDGPHFELSR